MKDTFLRLFTEAIKFPEFDTTAAHLVVEHDIGRITADYQRGGRIDIYLESAGKYIFIENKIYAGDQQNQLARYLAHQRNARLLYLTLDGIEASDWSSGGLAADQYQVLSYKKDIVAWLEKCRQAASAYPLVRETIVQYQHLINYLTGNTLNDFMKEEMKHLLKASLNNFASASALVQAYEETRQGFDYSLREGFEQEWRSRFEQNLSPVPEFAVYFRLHNNSYGFRAEKNGVEVAANSEEALRPLIALALAIPKFKRDNNWLGWKWMDNRYFDNLQPEVLYLAATNDEARTRLFEERMREVTPYFEQFKEMTEKLKEAK